MKVEEIGEVTEHPATGRAYFGAPCSAKKSQVAAAAKAVVQFLQPIPRASRRRAEDKKGII
jgi:hypothetical protein